MKMFEKCFMHKIIQINNQPVSSIKLADLSNNKYNTPVSLIILGSKIPGLHLARKMDLKRDLSEIKISS